MGIEVLPHVAVVVRQGSRSTKYGFSLGSLRKLYLSINYDQFFGRLLVPSQVNWRANLLLLVVAIDYYCCYFDFDAAVDVFTRRPHNRGCSGKPLTRMPTPTQTTPHPASSGTCKTSYEPSWLSQTAPT